MSKQLRSARVMSPSGDVWHSTATPSFLFVWALLANKLVKSFKIHIHKNAWIAIKYAKSILWNNLMTCCLGKAWNASIFLLWENYFNDISGGERQRHPAFECFHCDSLLCGLEYRLVICAHLNGYTIKLMMLLKSRVWSSVGGFRPFHLSQTSFLWHDKYICVLIFTVIFSQQDKTNAPIV